MSVSYQAVGWNRQKKLYDLVVVGGVVLYLALFVGGTFALHPDATAETALIRGLGTAALLLLHVVLSIGPLCRLDRRFLPLLYNRRHLGVTMFLLALSHGVFSMLQFHGFGDLDPLTSVLASGGDVGALSRFPFQPLGLAALGILFLMAATSHDFWLANLTAPVWKALHMLVYVAYALVLAHVALGVLQYEDSPILVVLLVLGFVWIVGLHLLAARREAATDTEAQRNTDGLVDACGVDELLEGRGKVLLVEGERLAIFRYDGKVSVLSSVCQHQNGPLGEGRIVDGLVVCPWHGYQYKPDCGSSPAPFNEKVPTFRVEVQNGRVLVDPRPNPAGTHVEPARIDEGGTAHG